MTVKRQQETFELVTLGHIRLARVPRSARLLHLGTLPPQRDNQRRLAASRDTVRWLCSRMVCTRCGMIGADVRPDWGPHVNKRRV
jgi:hypothetical protein